MVKGANDGTTALVPVAPQVVRIWQLPAQTDLNALPANWSEGRLAHVPDGAITLPQRAIQQAPPAQSADRTELASSAILAHEEAASAHFVGSAETFKRLFKLPFSRAAVSVPIHRVGRALIVDGEPLLPEQQASAVRSSAARIKRVQPGGSERGGAPGRIKATIGAHDRLLYSKFVHHSIASGAASVGNDPSRPHALLTADQPAGGDSAAGGAPPPATPSSPPSPGWSTPKDAAVEPPGGGTGETRWTFWAPASSRRRSAQRAAQHTAAGGCEREMDRASAPLARADERAGGRGARARSPAAADARRRPSARNGHAPSSIAQGEGASADSTAPFGLPRPRSQLALWLSAGFDDDEDAAAERTAGERRVTDEAVPTRHAAGVRDSAAGCDPSDGLAASTATLSLAALEPHACASPEGARGSNARALAAAGVARVLSARAGPPAAPEAGAAAEPGARPAEPGARPSAREFLPRVASGFRQVVQWELCGWKLLLGSDTLVFGNAQHPAVTLQLCDLEREIAPTTCLDFWLDNVMAGVPEVAVCGHRRGIVSGYKVLRTEDVPCW